MTKLFSTNELTNSNQPLTKSRRFKPYLYAIAIVLIMIIAVCAYLYYQVRDDILPPFDEAKAKQLLPEKRRQYDVQLFNQMMVRGEMPLEPRYQLFRKMADDGFEVAYIALELFDIRYSDLPQKYPKGLDRLKELAKKGDNSAQCFYGLFGQYIEKNSKEEESLKAAYINNAAMKEHPACLTSYALTLKNGSEEQISLMKNAAEKGDAAAQSLLAYAYADGNGVSQDFSLARCWANEAFIQSKTKDAASLVQIIAGMEKAIQRKGITIVKKEYLLGTNCSKLQS